MHFKGIHVKKEKFLKPYLLIFKMGIIIKAELLWKLNEIINGNSSTHGLLHSFHKMIAMNRNRIHSCAFQDILTSSSSSSLSYHHHHHCYCHHDLHHHSPLTLFLPKTSFMPWALLRWHTHKSSTRFSNVAQPLPLFPTLAFYCLGKELAFSAESSVPFSASDCLFICLFIQKKLQRILFTLGIL